MFLITNYLALKQNIPNENTMFEAFSFFLFHLKKKINSEDATLHIKYPDDALI